MTVKERSFLLTTYLVSRIGRGLLYCCAIFEPRARAHFFRFMSEHPSKTPLQVARCAPERVGYNKYH